MRKKIALLLSAIMILTTLPNANVFGATLGGTSQVQGKFKFMQRQRGITFGSNQSTPDDAMSAPTLKSDEASMEWEVGEIRNESMDYNTGIYTLNYYVQDIYSEEMKRIQLDVHVGEMQNPLDPTALLPATESAVVQVKVFNKIGAQENLDYTHYTNEGSKVINGNNFMTTLKLDNKAFTWDKELDLKIGNYARTRLHIKDGKVQLSTTNIPKGYLIPFDLALNGLNNEKINIFKGLNHFRVEPQHLYTTSAALGLQSKETISAEDKLLGSTPGSRPGIKVSVQLPKYLKGTQFIAMPTDEAKKIVATMKLQQEFLQQGDSTSLPKQITFKMEDKGNIYEGYEDGKGNALGTVSREGDNFVLYLTDRKNCFCEEQKPAGEACPICQAVAAQVVEWPSLKTGIMLQTQLYLKGGEFENVSNNAVTPDKMGHTYIHYTASRVGINDVAFELIPYNINGPVTYKLLEDKDNDGDWEEEDGPSVYYKEGSQNKKVTLTTTRGSNAKYRVVISLGEKDKDDKDKDKYYSQILKYDPTTEAAPLPLPEIISANNVYVVPGRKINEKPDPQAPAIGLDLTWRAPSEEELREFLVNGDIYYEINLYDKAQKNPKSIKIVKVSLEENKVVIKDYAGDMDLPLYDNHKDTFTIPDMKIKKYEDIGTWQGFTIPKYDRNYPALTEITPANFPCYDIPNTYYLSVKGVYDKKGDAETLAKPLESNLESVAFDRRYEVIPVPKGIDSEPITGKETNGQKVQFDNIDLEKYISYMMDSVKLSLAPHGEASEQAKRTYEIYLYQNESIKGEQLNGVTKVLATTGGQITLKEEDLDFLRTRKEEQGQKDAPIRAIRFDYTSTSNNTEEKAKLEIEGLDPNQVYYVQIRVRLDAYDVLDQYASWDIRYSLFSKVHSFTTSTKPIPPTPDEQVPPSPNKFFVDEQVNNTTVKLGWEPPKFTTGEENTVHYEILRSKDVEIKKEDLLRNKKILDVLQGNNVLKGFKTKEKGLSTIHVYKDGSWQQLDPVQPSMNLRITDNTLSPNAIYYYYIRTIKVVEGQEVASDWIMLPVTTEPVGRPIRLKVESVQDYKYEGRTETVVSFWAPIPKDGKVPDQYDFDIAVKGEKDDDFRLDYKVNRLKEEVVDEHYKLFVYKVSGLKPGSRYDIKVRIKDKTKPQELGAEYPTSLYSDQVTARTEYDEEDAEKDNKFEEYLKKYDQEAEKLRRKPYWTVEGSRWGGTYKYRPSYIKTELAVAHEYELVSSEDDDKLYYYMPASMLEAMNSNNTTLVIKIGKSTVNIRPYTLTEKLERIKEALEQIKDGKLKDYYIAIEVSTKAYSGTINQEEALSPEITVDLDMVYIDKEDMIVEDDIMHELNLLIDAGRKDVIDDLEYLILQKGKIEEDNLDNIIEKAINKIKEKHAEKVKRILDKGTNKAKSIEAIDKPILIIAKTDAYAVNAYYDDGSWQTLYAFATNGGFALEAAKLGTYIFTGKEAINTLMPTIPGAQDIIGKYQLTAFFEVESNKMDWYATKSQVYGSIARILGAKQGVDYIEFLNMRGIKGINRIGMNNAIRKDESIYLIMQTYENINYKPIGSIYIKNKQSVNNIGSFQSQYRPYVYAAVELGVVAPVNNKIQASNGVTAKEIIQMLSKIVPK